MSQVCKTAKIVTAHMDLLDKGGFRIDKGIVLEDPVYFFNTPVWINRVFKDSLDNDTIERFILKRDVVCIRDYHGALT